MIVNKSRKAMMKNTTYDFNACMHVPVEDQYVTSIITL